MKHRYGHGFGRCALFSLSLAAGAFGQTTTTNLNNAVSPPVVAIQATTPLTSEPAPNVRVRPGIFTITRTGPTTGSLRVYLAYGGTATAGEDYVALPQSVEIPAGTNQVDLTVAALEDTLAEGDETVVASFALVPFPYPPPYIVDSKQSEAKVVIHDNDQPPFSMASIETTQPVAEESSYPFKRLPAVGEFKISRTAPTNNSLTLFLLLSGTAVNGEDYQELPWMVTIPAGATSITLQVKAKPDNLPEGEETVIAKISDCPPVTHPPLGIPCFAYPVDPAHDTAKVVIRDTAEIGLSARIEITAPTEGDRFPAGVPIKIDATAIDPRGYIPQVEFLADQQVIGVSRLDFFRAPDPGTPIYHSIEWRDAKIGPHVLLARGADAQGNLVFSKPVNITVGNGTGTVSRIVFERHLPAAYSPGTPFTVTIQVRLPATAAGAAGVGAYALEDQPPAGWTVSAITGDGLFDPATGRVKFGPFTDARDRTLTYQVTSPTTASGARQFKGTGSADGVLYEISGDNSITSSILKHPADINPSDNAITLGEVTAYAGAWKFGKAWSQGPNPIPLSYVTRAGWLWQRGEKYFFDPSAGPPPLSWVPGTRAITLSSAAPATSSTAVRELPARAAANVPFRVVVRAAPARGVSSYAVEERPPAGWAVHAIGEGGVYDPAMGIIRWGLFLDDQPRTLPYEVVPPRPGDATGTFAGRASFDGTEIVVGGASQVDVTPEVRIAQITRLAKGEVQLTLRGDPAQIYYELEGSADLVHWTHLGTFMPGNVSFFYLDASATNQPQRFYRAFAR